MKRLTEFGRFIRKFRLDHDVTLRDMAKTLKINENYLSSIECGLKVTPKNLADRILAVYQMDALTADELRKSLLNSSKRFVFVPTSTLDARLLGALKTKLNEVNDEFKINMIKLLEEE